MDDEQRLANQLQPTDAEQGSQLARYTMPPVARPVTCVSIPPVQLLGRVDEPPPRIDLLPGELELIAQHLLDSLDALLARAADVASISAIDPSEHSDCKACRSGKL